MPTKFCHPKCLSVAQNLAEFFVKLDQPQQVGFRLIFLGALDDQYRQGRRNLLPQNGGPNIGRFEEHLPKGSQLQDRSLLGLQVVRREADGHTALPETDVFHLEAQGS
jgi:hypothetical protein